MVCIRCRLQIVFSMLSVTAQLYYIELQHFWNPLLYSTVPSNHSWTNNPHLLHLQIFWNLVVIKPDHDKLCTHPPITPHALQFSHGEFLRGWRNIVFTYQSIESFSLNQSIFWKLSVIAFNESEIHQILGIWWGLLQMPCMVQSQWCAYRQFFLFIQNQNR